MDVVYLDHNATTKPADEVVEAMADCLRRGWANPSSFHRPGQEARRQVELARETVARLIGSRERELVLTSGGTEAANLALRGVLAARPDRNVLVTSRLEHSAVRELAEALEKRGTEVVWLPNDGHGVVDPDALRSLLAKRADEIALVSVMWANNETGVIQPVDEIGRRCREHGVPFFADATQSVGKMPVDVSCQPVDVLSFAAHKFHGPMGAGGLYVRRGVQLEAQIIGGPQERERRAGTENVPGIVGMGVAARLAADWLDTDGPREMLELRDSFERGLLEAVDDATINGAGAPRLWNTTNVAFAKLEAEPILLALSERGVCASAGAACSSGSLDPSPVLEAMGVPAELVAGSIRFSYSRGTTVSELDRAMEVIPVVIAKLRKVMSVV